MDPNQAFTSGLDRRAEERLRPDWLEPARGDPGTVYLAMYQGAALVRPAVGEGSARLALLDGSDPRVAGDIAESAVLLGWYHAQRCVLVDLPPPLAAPSEGERFAELRPLVSELPAEEAALAAYARAMHLWHAAHHFCGRCGGKTLRQRAGHARVCASCGQTHFPRLDPAIIVLVHDGDHALLGRQASWPPERYSTIAGFVEPGESLEDAVRREVREEAGVEPLELTYRGSQPWPFPSSLMLGFTATASGRTTPQLHDGELEDARWFSREQIRSGDIRLPPPQAISRQLIDWWLEQA